MEKSQLRSVMREQRRKLDPLAKERAAENLCRQFTQHKIWHQIKHLGIYYPMVEELDTRRVIDAAWKAGKAVYLPTVDVEKNTMHFYPYQPNDDLVASSWGTLQPQRQARHADNKLDGLIVPALCVDRHGFRIGYGYGYYDRFLNTHKKHLVSVAVAFSCGHVSNIPREAWDQPCDFVILAK